MRALALRVPRADGERLRRQLVERGLLRTDLAIERDGEWLYLPLIAPPTDLGTSPPVEEREFADPTEAVARSYKELVDLSEEIERKLPRSFDVVGDIVLIRLPPELSPHAAAIGRALLEFVPGARLVAEDRGVKGTARIRELHVLAGEGPFRTQHRENGLTFTVDLERAYFSPRLAREHADVAGQVGANESILDLCCGVGPFARTIVREAPTAQAVAVDSNRAAIDLLEGDLRTLPERDRILPVCADAADFLRSAGAFDRAILNLPHDGAAFLPALGSHLRANGTVHYYEVVERDELLTRREEIREALARSAPFQLVEEHVVHEYSPRSDLRAYRFERRPAA